MRTGAVGWCCDGLPAFRASKPLSRFRGCNRRNRMLAGWLMPEVGIRRASAVRKPRYPDQASFRLARTASITIRAA